MQHAREKSQMRTKVWFRNVKRPLRRYGLRNGDNIKTDLKKNGVGCGLDSYGWSLVQRRQVLVINEINCKVSVYRV